MEPSPTAAVDIYLQQWHTAGISIDSLTRLKIDSAHKSKHYKHIMH